MSHYKIINENQLDQWVKGNARIAQGVIVELVFRLVAASSPNPKERRFPLGDSIGQHGPDGFLDTDFANKPFVQEGRSYWEIGTGNDARKKATSDYNGLVRAIPEAERLKSTFVFVTPLSGRTDWPYTWKEDDQKQWVEDRRKRKDWRGVQVIDGTRLIDWLMHFPAVAHWLAGKMGLPIRQLKTIEQHWDDLKTIGSPPPLIPGVFLANREAACEKLKEVFSRNMTQLQLDTRYPTQVVDFIAAYVASLDGDKRSDSENRCLIIRGEDGWNAITYLRDSHILVAGFDLESTGSEGTILLEKARRAGHVVIYSGMPGGIPHPNRISVRNPRSHHIEEALVKAGYKEERARLLSHKSNGNLGSLLRVIQNLSVKAEWYQDTEAAELVIAELLGAWQEQSKNDKSIAEKLSGKAYGEWIGKIRDIVLRPATPLTHREGNWKFVFRYEGWYTLGQRIFDEHLDRLKEVAVNVLRERDPKFELPPGERFASNILGKSLTYSNSLRKGLAESLALLGCHPKALTSCTVGKAEATAVISVREILVGADWVLWASLNDLLPLLAEAAPVEFLDAVERQLNSDSCPFDAIFALEDTESMSKTYIAGLLGALETLAWDADYLTRVIVILGELAAIDPGGNWTNRPENSLKNILLPWLPQTCASILKRKTALEILVKESPDVAWKLLLNLLPNVTKHSSGSHKPAWRDMIADDWSRGVTKREYWEQISSYADLAVKEAKKSHSKLTDIIDHLDSFPLAAFDRFLAYFGSEDVVSLPEKDRLQLWNALSSFVLRHRKYADTDWALEPEIVNKIDEVAIRIAPDTPFYRYQSLFSDRDFDLFEEKNNYDEQRRKLENKRKEAINEIFTSGGAELVLDFAKEVESPWQVGFIFGIIAANDVEAEVLPFLLGAESKPLVQFAGGFVWGRFSYLGWEWVDGINMAQWSPSQKGQLLAYLPFTSETWERSTRLLKGDESPYWLKANVNPYDADKSLEVAIDHLLDHGRVRDAVRCLEKIIYFKQPLDNKQAIRVLKSVINSSKIASSLDRHLTVEVIKALQDEPDTNSDDLYQIEWAFLPLLDKYSSSFPIVLEQRLADDPAFFCEIIRLVFRSSYEERPTEEPTTLQKNIAENAYSLLSNWQTLPGSRKEGGLNSDALVSWLADVKMICMESGHLEVALQMVGHVFTHAPADPDGLWIHHSVAKELNAKDAKEIRVGFSVEMWNSRGVYSWTAGREELELAAKYRKKAEEVEACGYHRFADSLKELAASYEREAERNASRDLDDDL